MAKSACALLKDLFGDDLFLEVMYHGIDIEKLIMPDIFKLSKEMDIPVIATNDGHYLEKEQSVSHEVLMCMNGSKCLQDPKHLHFPYPEFYLKSAEEMGQIFGHVPQAIYNTLAVAERVDNKDITSNLFGGGTRLPMFDVPKSFNAGKPFEGQFAYLKSLAMEGMRKRGWDASQRHMEALEKELGDIRIAWENNSLDFATYFLIEHDIFDFANKNNILCGPGRGSGFASVLLHALGICYGVDPIGDYGLIWERFLGFDQKRVIREEDFGFEKDKSDISQVIESEELMEENEDDGEFEE
jgi:DNA polymerase-3 subunit alpha